MEESPGEEEGVIKQKWLKWRGLKSRRKGNGLL